MKRVIGPLVLIGLGVFMGLFFWWKWVSGPVGGEGKPVVIVVAKGEAMDDIGRELKQQGVIRSVAAFKLMVMKLGVSRKIQAGDFRTSSKMSLDEIVKNLTRGSLDVWVTLPEGWRREQMAERLAENLPESFSAEEFIKLSESEEGYLFPDTYLVPREASAGAAINLLTETFQRKVGGVDRQTVILASIVEREAYGQEDRQMVADVLTKRLKVGMGLNADATLQYALGTAGEWWPIPEASDRLIKSAYNTYKYAGLPPAPIANPGLESIQAVKQAKETVYVYYLHDPEGKIHPAKTFEEHQANISRYLGGN